MLSASVDAQVAGMLRGDVATLVPSHVTRPIYDVRKYLTVTRADIEDYLRRHPGTAEIFFAERSQRPLIHESIVIGEEGDGYTVGVVDHGRLRFVRHFPTLISAVAENVLAEYGMA